MKTLKTMKTYKPTMAHDEFNNDVTALLRKYGDHLSAQDMLALMSQVVGKVLAFQDQRSMTPEMGLEVIRANIEVGNKQAVDLIRNATPAGNG